MMHVPFPIALLRQRHFLLVNFRLKRLEMFTSRLVSRLSRPWKFTSRATSSSSTTSTTSAGTSIAHPKPSLPTVPQAPNYPTTWSTNQRKRPVAGEGPRFEQTNMEFQPQPLSAMEMINTEPIRVVHGRRAVCDGGQRLISENVRQSFTCRICCFYRRRSSWAS